MQKSKFTKLLCLILSLIMILGTVPLTAFADDSDFEIEYDSMLRGYRGKGGDVVLPDCIREIDRDAFAGITTVNSVSMPNVEYVMRYAFRDCSLTSAIMPKVHYLDDGAFENCTNLTSITVSDGLWSVEEAFRNTKLTTVYCTCSSNVDNVKNTINNDAYEYVKLDHTYADGKCTACGYLCPHDFVDNVCSVCGYVCDHTIRVYTDNGDGTHTASCVCGKITEEKIAHSFNDYADDNNATCTTDGTKTAKCDYCEAADVITLTGTAKGHSFTGAYRNNGDGTHSIKCARCDTYSDAEAHEYTDTYVDNGDGTHSGKCICGEVSTEKVAHTFADSVCSFCGYKCVHNVVDGTCMICNSNSGEILRLLGTRIRLGTQNGTPVDWLVGGYGTAGMTAPDGCIALISAGLLAKTPFSTNNSNIYANSTLRSVVESLVTFSTADSEYLVSRTLEGGATCGYYCDGVAGPSVTAKIWVPTTNDGQGLYNIGYSTMGLEYWLCSPGSDETKAAWVWAFGGYAYSLGSAVNANYSVRPGCYIDSAKVCKLIPVAGAENTYTLDTHNFVNGVCTKCGLCLHINNFTDSYVNNGDGTHSGQCSCDEVSTEKTVHTFVNGVCSVCGAAYEYTAENNVLTATSNDAARTAYTLTLTENGTISAEEVSAWNGAYLTLPEIVFDTAANTASITAGDATAVVTLAEGALQAHSVKVICGADENGSSYITDVTPGSEVTVTAGTFENKAFEKWSAGLNINGSTDKTVTFMMPNEDVTVEAEFVDCYSLSVFDGTTLTSVPQKEGASENITVSDAPEGKIFRKWTAEGITIADDKASVLEFTMPANAVMLTANYDVLYTVTVKDGTVTDGGTATTAFAGDTVYVSADADTDDSRFTAWSSEEDIVFANENSSTASFTMPETDVTVTAEREQSHTVTVTDGTVVSGLNGADKAFPGQTIKVRADSLCGRRFTGWTGEGVTFANAANASTTFTMPESDVTVKANQEAIKVTPPTAGTGTYTYNGMALTYRFASSGDANLYSVSGNRQTNAGTYTVKASLTVDGTVWADGTTADKEYTFTINRYPVEKPMAYNTRYYYDGTEQDFILCKRVGATYYYYESTVPAGSVTIANRTRTNAGTQTVTATPTENFCWSDGTTDTLSFTFTVNGLPIPTLFEDPRSFTYNGMAQTYTPFVFLDGKLYDFDGYLYNLTNRTKTASGSYTVTATLNDNYCWSDGSFGPRNFTFDIRNKELNSYIYYVEDLKTGDIVTNVDNSYTEYDDTRMLKGFERHPAFKPEMLKDRYQPYLANAPYGSEATFYLKETPGTPKTVSEINKCTRWDYVKMSDLKPDTIYYMFAVVSHPDYPYAQITEVNNMSRFITSDPMFSLVNCKRVTEKEVNQNYKSDCLIAMWTGNINVMLGAFGNKSTSKKVNLTTKVANYTVFEDAIAQGIRDIEEGLDGALVGWYQDGELLSYSIFPSNVNQFKSVLYGKKSVSAPKNRLAAPAGEPTEPTPIEITGITGEAPAFTLELLNSLFTPEQIAALHLLDNVEFRVEKDLEIEPEKIRDRNNALIERLAALGILPDAEEPEEFTPTVNVETLLYDLESEPVSGGTKAYELELGDLLPADASKEIVGYTFVGLFYKEIMGVEKDYKPEEATGDHGMILTQGLTKWDPETDYVMRDTELMAIYVKNGAEEPVGYKAAGTTFTAAGSEVTVTLPLVIDGMTYGDILNENEELTVSAIEDGKITVTLTNDVTADDSFTFKVFVNANAEGIEDPYYYILVTVNAIDDTEIREEAKEAVEALADDDSSDVVKAIVSEALAALEDANSVEGVNKIVDDAKAAVALQKAKEEALAAINEFVDPDDKDEIKAAAEEAKAAIDNAESVEEVEAVRNSVLKKMDEERYRCPFCGKLKHKNVIDWFFCIVKRIITLFLRVIDYGRGFIIE